MNCVMRLNDIKISFKFAMQARYTAEFFPTTSVNSIAVSHTSQINRIMLLST